MVLAISAYNILILVHRHLRLVCFNHWEGMFTWRLGLAVHRMKEGRKHFFLAADGSNVHDAQYIEQLSYEYDKTAWHLGFGLDKLAAWHLKASERGLVYGVLFTFFVLSLLKDGRVCLYCIVEQYKRQLSAELHAGKFNAKECIDLLFEPYYFFE